MPDPAPESSIDALRKELKSLGYLTHGIERWFALDPWSSRTFWAELFAVSSKAALLSSLFATLPLLAITIIRNRPLGLGEVAILGLLQLLTAFIGVFAVIVAVALGLRKNPGLAIDSPRLLTSLTLTVTGGLSLLILLWWSGFGGVPDVVELTAGGALILLFLLASSVIVSAALLSFSIHEAKRVPAMHRKDRAVPMTVAAAVIGLAIGIWSMSAGQTTSADAPTNVPVVETRNRIALIAVDGLTPDIFNAQKPAEMTFAAVAPAAELEGTRSSAERWATLGTGTSVAAHGVHAIDGVRLAGTGHVLQSVSRYSFAIDLIARPLGLAERVPLPPTVRRRHYVWEILGGRGIASVAVNWWVTGDSSSPGLVSISQSTLFAETASKMPGDSAKLAVAIDAAALGALDSSITRSTPRFATVYLPALDIVLNRIDLDAGARLAASVNVMRAMFAEAQRLQRAGYEVIVVGMPGDRQGGSAIVATTLPINRREVALADVAPSILHAMGFPVAEEMSGRPLVDGHEARTVPTYGDRGASGGDAKTSDEYYKSLKSLGYVQ